VHCVGFTYLLQAWPSSQSDLCMCVCVCVMQNVNISPVDSHLSLAHETKHAHHLTAVFQENPDSCILLDSHTRVFEAITFNKLDAVSATQSTASKH